MTFIAYSDASFATRSDLSSQGGYLLAMCHKDVANGKCEGHYNVIDWRSWKLPRVSRSTLSAESQAASEAADSLMYTSLFWNLIFKALMPLDSVSTGHLRNSPKLIVDAKALYDVLVKDEIQAATGADKRTTIEALVCRDKLSCCNGKVMWVSSELQYADGLTKDSAAALLGQRLRSHMTRLKSDETVQASKRKNVTNRKKGENMYAIRRPERALFAMFANYFLDTVNALEEKDGNSTGTMSHYKVEEHDLTDYFVMILMIMFIGVFTWLFWRWMQGPKIVILEKKFKENDAQTTRTGLEEQRLVELRKENITITKQNQRLKEELAVSEQARQDAQRELRVLAEEHHSMKETQQADFNQKFKVAGQQASFKPVYLASQGGCWHASRACVAQRTANLVYERQPCKACAHLFFDKCTPTASGEGVHWVGGTHGTLFGVATSSEDW